MTTPSVETPVKNPGASGERPVRTHRVRGIVVVISMILPAIVCAFLASYSGRWDLFERFGSIITAVGLLVASRRYVQFGVAELAMLQADNQAKPDSVEVLSDILNVKRGLALSAFGTVIWGWGEYLRWWSFVFLVIWALIAIRDARRDSNKADHDNLR